jgi:hypothetical protein
MPSRATRSDVAAGGTGISRNSASARRALRTSVEDDADGEGARRGASSVEARGLDVRSPASSSGSAIRCRERVSEGTLSARA